MANYIKEIVTGLDTTVQEIRKLTESAYILRMNKNGLDFIPGQYINLGIKGVKESRAYSIYSSPRDNYLDVLVKEVDDGIVSPLLKKVEPGTMLHLDGPYGYFVINKNNMSKKFFFIATGTGISPFHSFISTYPTLDYKLLHGIRYGSEAYEKSFYDPDRYISCTTRSKSGHFHGRVTDYLVKHYLEPGTLCFLCGNHKMIYEAYNILKAKGIKEDHIFAEVYF